jgi:RNA polymerase sigma-70 factor, ECF subfamily
VLDDSARDLALRTLWDRGRERHGALVLPLPTFAAQLGARGVVLTEGWERLHAEDVYLASACAEDVADAIAIFMREHAAAVEGFVRTVERRPDAAKDIAQEILCDVLVGRPPVAPRLAAYSGRGPLRAWLRMIAVRRSYNDIRDHGSHRAIEDRVYREAVNASLDPDVSYLKRKYETDFAAAFTDAFQALAPASRTLLRLHYGEALGLAAIGALNGWSKPTASRRIAEAREALFTGACALLEERLSLHGSELGSLLRVMRSQLEVSLSGLISKTSA